VAEIMRLFAKRGFRVTAFKVHLTLGRRKKSGDDSQKA